MPKRKIVSQPRLKAYALCRSEYNTPFVFYLYSDKVKDAERFVHNMRVEISRLKNYAETLGRVVIPFKMKVVDYQPGVYQVEEEDDDGNMVTVEKHMKVTLKKAKGKDTELTKEVSDVLDEITAGVKVDV